MKNVAAPAAEGLCSPINMAEVEFGISTSSLTFLPSSGGHLSVTLASSQTGNSPWQETSYHMGLFTDSKHVIWKQLKADDGNDWRQKKLDGITDSVDMNLGKLWEMVRDRYAAVHGVTKSQTWLGDWTTTKADSVTIHLRELAFVSH